MSSLRYKSNAMMIHELLKFLNFFKKGKLLGKVVPKLFINITVVKIDVSPKHWDLYLELSFQYLLSSLVGVCKNALKTRQCPVANQPDSQGLHLRYPRYGEDPDTGWSRGTQILGA